MLSEAARILQVSDSSMLLETSRKSTCGKCGMKNGCGQYLLAPERATLLIDRNLADMSDAASARKLVPGASVTLSMEGPALSGLALLFYLLPLGMLLLATLLASVFTGNEFWLAISAGAGLVSGFRMLPAMLRTLARTFSCYPLVAPVGDSVAAPSSDPESCHEI